MRNIIVLLACAFVALVTSGTILSDLDQFIDSPASAESMSNARGSTTTYSDQEIQKMDFQMANLRTAVELVQEFRRTHRLPNNHWLIQEIYALFYPVLQAANNA